MFQNAIVQAAYNLKLVQYVTAMAEIQLPVAEI